MQILQKDNKETIEAWTFYDWANSVFPLVSEIVGGMRLSVLSLILYFVIGFIGLLFVPKTLK